MEKSNPSNQETVGDRLIKEISQLLYIALGEGAAVCQVCGDELREGSPLTAYAFRPADKPTYEIGHVKCAEDRHAPTEHFTRGVRELVVSGRVGRCRDQATQSAWPVLLAPEPVAVSPASTPDVIPQSEGGWFRQEPEACDDVQPVEPRDEEHRLPAHVQGDAGQPWQRPVVMRWATVDTDRHTDAECPADVHRILGWNDE